MLLLSYLFVLNSAALAQVPSCAQMGEDTCGPGNRPYADATGEVRSWGDTWDKAKVLFSKAQKDNAADIAAALKDDPEFRAEIIQITGLSDDPVCSSKKKTDVAKCNEDLQLILPEILNAHLDVPTIPGFAPSLEMLDKLKGNETYNRIFEKRITEVTAAIEMDGAREKRKVREEIFPDVSARMIEMIKAKPMDAQVKQRLIQRISSVKLTENGCALEGRKSLMTLVNGGAYYNVSGENKNSISICPGDFVSSTSEFQTVFKLAHELAHSFDPCVIGLGTPGPAVIKYSSRDDLEKSRTDNPWGDSIKCLRGGESIAAKPPEGSSTTASYGAFCNDQIQEAFCDQVAAGILADYMEKKYDLSPEQARVGYANALRFGRCPGADEAGKSMHPRTEDRVNRILMANPKVQAQTGCPSVGVAMNCAGEPELGAGPKSQSSPSSEAETESGGAAVPEGSK